jgi:hypothetical protein
MTTPPCLLHSPATWPVQRAALARAQQGECKNGATLQRLLVQTSASQRAQRDFCAVKKLLSDAFLQADPLWWEKTLPFIATLALRSEELFSDDASSPLSYLPPGHRGSLRLSRTHIASILALAFFDAIPRASVDVDEWDMPGHLTFQVWLSDDWFSADAQKSICLVHYFATARDTFARDLSREAIATLVGRHAAEGGAEGDDCVVISRLVLNDADKAAAADPQAGWEVWLGSQAPLAPLEVRERASASAPSASFPSSFARE